MDHTIEGTSSPLANLTKDQWVEKLAEITRSYGRYRQLGAQHFASYIEGDETLLVTFETMQGVRSLSDTGQPYGWELSKTLGWSNLCFASDGDTWFRTPEIWDYVDDLIDEGFFDQFEKVIFYGAGPCGYAALAYSVAAPGCTVVAVQPQATLDPRLAEWDRRFTTSRRLDFTTRFGFAPAMADAAEDVFLIYDPTERLDAMHAALFHQPHIHHFRLRHVGGAVQSALLNMRILDKILTLAGRSQLTPLTFARLYRARRNYPPYLRRLLAELSRRGRDNLSFLLASNVTSRMVAPRFQRHLEELQAKLGKGNAAE